MRNQRIFLAVFFICGAVYLSGCVVAAVGAGAAGTVAFFRGDLEAVESASLERVYKATERTVEKLKLGVTKVTRDSSQATFVVRDAAGEKITIKLKATAKNTTKLSIRIGMFGDEIKSRQIYQKIHDTLSGR